MQSHVGNNWKLYRNKVKKERFCHASTTCLERLTIIIKLKE